MKLRQIFSPLQKGDVCTGTIARFGLQSARLIELGYIVEKAGDYVFLGFKRGAR